MTGKEEREYMNARRERLQKKRKRALIGKAVMLFVLLVILIVCIFFVFIANKKEDDNQKNGSATAEIPFGSEDTEETMGENVSGETEQDQAGSGEKASVMEQAAYLAAGYDYDRAIELLQTIPGYDTDSDVSAAIAEYQATKNSCVAVDVDTVPHIFYHSLMNDTVRAFNVSVLGQSLVD